MVPPPPPFRNAVEPGSTRLDGLRVAMVNWREPAQRAAGGAEEYAWQVSLGLRDLGAEVHFVTSRERGQARREEREAIRLVRMGGTYSRYPLVMAWLLRHRGRFDVVVDCMNGIPFFSPLVVSRRRTRVILLVHHVHCEQFFVYFDKLRAALGKAIEGPVARRLYRRHATVAISPSTAAAMRGRLRWRGPIFVVPNGTTPLGGPDTVAPASGPSLVFVGRLVTHKRVDLLIEAAATLRERRPGLTLHIVGRGPEQPRLAALIAERGLSGTVTLHGFLPAEEKNALLAGADLHLTASEFEGWGLSVVEAASLGVPTVAYDIDGLRDAVRDGETGWLAGPGERLADTAERALKELADPVRRAEIAAACVGWANTFSWAASTERLAALIRRDSMPSDGGEPYVATFRTLDGAVHSVIVENTDPARLRSELSALDLEILDIRPATHGELLTGSASPLEKAAASPG